jgi:hypothetical protein
MDFLSIDWWPSGAAGVLLLFLLPAGPGATLGILVGKNAGLAPLAIAGLYIAGDVIRAAYFDPLLRIVGRCGSRRSWSRRVAAQLASLATRTHLGPGRFGQLSGLTLVSFGGGFTVGSIALANAGINRALAWFGVVLGDVAWFGFKLAAALGLSSVFGDDRLVFVAVAVLAMAAGPSARRLRGPARGMRPGVSASSSPPR